MVPTQQFPAEHVAMRNAVIEATHESWKTRAFAAFRVPILSRPHTLLEVEEGEYSCRVLFHGLKRKDLTNVERFFNREIESGGLMRAVTVDPIPGGIHAMVLGKAPSVESVLDNIRYLAPKVLLGGSIEATREAERFMVSFQSEELMHYLMGDISKFAKVRLVAEEQIHAPLELMFPRPLRRPTWPVTPLDAKILLEALESGYYDEGPRRMTQDEMAKKLEISKKVLNTRLRRLLKTGLAALLSPFPPPQALVDSVITQRARKKS